MSYPPAPWKLLGRGLQTMQLVDVVRARAFVPPELVIVHVLPGKTLASVYAAEYGPGSFVQYNELIVAPALVRRGRSIGFWISNIYVDNEDSVAGGREIWGLPKEMAQFEWREGEESQVIIRQGDRPLCTLSHGPQRRLWRMPVPTPILSVLDGQLMSALVTFSSRFSLGRITLDVPPASPFAGIGLGPRGLPYHHHDLVVHAGAPKRIGPLAMPARPVRAKHGVA